MAWFFHLPLGQDALPEGNGKQAIQAYCVQCHDLSSVTRTGYDERGWRNNLDMMINVGSTLPRDQIAEVTQYLAKNFPERPRPAAVLIPGSAKVTIKEWIVPTPGSRPHDPLATADGAIWYTGQFANVLGRLHPKTGRIKEYPLTPKAGPHGLTADKDGNIWYTANFGSRVGKLNPKTGELTNIHAIPRAYPHTPIFDQKGTLWFTVQGNMVGRLTEDRDVKLVLHLRLNHALRYGGKFRYPFPRVSSAATRSPASIQRWRFANTTCRIKSRPRRIAITGDVCSGTGLFRGFLGRSIQRPAR
jgi:virginiamycin B lyase